MERRSRLFRYLIAVFACLWPIASQANVGVGVFLNYVVYAWFLLIPIIGIEAYVLGKRLDISAGRAVGVAVMANIASTLLGSVIVFIVSFIVSLRGLEVRPGAWEDVSMLFILVPCFFLTAWSEAILSYPHLKPHSRQQVMEVFYLANGFTYALLTIVPVANLIKNAMISGRAMWY